MTANTTLRTARYTAFISLAVIVNGLVWAFRTNSFFVSLGSRQDLIRSGLFFDCAITIPLCYWLLLVRPGLRGKTSLIIVGGLSLIRGAYLLSSHLGLFIGIAAEAGLAVFIVTKVRRIEDVLPSKTLARIFSAEIDVYRYAFGRSQPPALPAGARAFTIHEASGAASLFWMLACLTPIEAGAVHFLLPAKIAWILTALSIYGAIWMIAVARSFVALPIVVDAEGITLRRGMLGSMYIPWDAIASVSGKGDGRKYARFAVLADPTVWITFDRPLTARLTMGFTREAMGASVAADDKSGFLEAINGK